MRYKKLLNVNWLRSYKPSKLTIKKDSRPFESEAIFFASLYSESLLFGQNGFNYRSLQNLRAYNFEFLWPTLTNDTSFERSKQYLLGWREKNPFVTLLSHFLLTQNTPKSYYNWPIDPEWERLNVDALEVCGNLYSLWHNGYRNWDEEPCTYTVYS